MISVCPQKKINAKKSNNYGIRQHILEEMYADLKEINLAKCVKKSLYSVDCLPGIHKALCTVVSCVRVGRLVQ